MQNDWFDGMEAICFSGHRPEGLPDRGRERGSNMDRLKFLVQQTVLTAAERGVHTFLAGGAAGFDLIASEAVLALKGDLPQLRLVLALPAKNQAASWPEPLKRRYDRLLLAASQIYYASESDLSGTSMRQRNRYLVDHADGCIAYLMKMTGGTLYTVNYALNQEKPVLNLAEQFKS